ncbi:MAG: glycosyltransferase family 2 protein [Candidatus Woesearchaeota archaeon]
MIEEYELSITIPCFNELKSLPLLIEKYEKAKKKIKFQLVIVDNGSKDNTWKYIQKIRKEYDFIKLIRIKDNIGYGNGINIGLQNCDSKIVGWSHGDLQCSPEDIFIGYDIYKKSNGNMLVKGHRKMRDWKSLILTYGLQILSSIILLKYFDDINGQPKIFDKELIKTFKSPPKGFSYDLYVQYKAIKNDYKIIPFDVMFTKRIYGLSKWTYSIMGKMDNIKSFIKDIWGIRIGRLN